MTHQTASLFRRLATLCYDTIVVFAVIIFATFVAVIFNKGRAIPPGNHWLIWYLLASVVTYFMLSWKMYGQTIGMRAWRLHLQTESGEPLQWKHCWLRIVVAIPSLLLFGIGWIFGLHDKLSSTQLTYSQQ